MADDSLSLWARVSVLMALALTPSCRTPLETASLALSPRFETSVVIASARARCVLDTGSGASLLAAGFVDRVGLEDVATPDPAGLPVSDGVDVRMLRRMVLLAGLRIGGNEFVGFPVPVLPATATHFPADGILGLDVLQSAAWIFDAGGGRVVCADTDRLDGEIEARGLTVVERLPLLVREGHLFVLARLEGVRDVEMMLDTGAAKSTLSRRTTEALQLRSGAELERREREQFAARLRAELERLGYIDSAVRVLPTGGAERTPFVGIHGREVAYQPYWLQRLELGGQLLADLCVYSADGARDVLGADALAQVMWSLDPVRREVCILDPSR